MNKLQYLKQYTLQKFGNDLLMAFVPFSKVCTWNTFSVRLTIFIKFIMEEESSAERHYLESIISKIVQRTTNNHSLSQSKQQTQAPYTQKEEITISINLGY